LVDERFIRRTQRGRGMGSHALDFFGREAKHLSATVPISNRIMAPEEEPGCGSGFEESPSPSRDAEDRRKAMGFI
jgi:hypothetical protein